MDLVKSGLLNPRPRARPKLLLELVIENDSAYSQSKSPAKNTGLRYSALGSSKIAMAGFNGCDDGARRKAQPDAESVDSSEADEKVDTCASPSKAIHQAYTKKLEGASSDKRLACKVSFLRHRAAQKRAQCTRSEHRQEMDAGGEGIVTVTDLKSLWDLNNKSNIDEARQKSNAKTQISLGHSEMVEGLHETRQVNTAYC